MHIRHLQHANQLDQKVTGTITDGDLCPMGLAANGLALVACPWSLHLTYLHLEIGPRAPAQGSRSARTGCRAVCHAAMIAIGLRTANRSQSVAVADGECFHKALIYYN